MYIMMRHGCFKSSHKVGHGADTDAHGRVINALEKKTREEKGEPSGVAALNREYSDGRNKDNHVCRSTSTTGGAGDTGDLSSGTDWPLMPTSSSSSSNKSNKVSSSVDVGDASVESKLIASDGEDAAADTDADGVADTSLGRTGPPMATAAARLGSGGGAGRGTAADGITTGTWVRIDGPTCALDFNRRN
jgi:hypothetical protein